MRSLVSSKNRKTTSRRLWYGVLGSTWRSPRKLRNLVDHGLLDVGFPDPPGLAELEVFGISGFAPKRMTLLDSVSMFLDCIVARFDEVPGLHTWIAGAVETDSARIERGDANLGDPPFLPLDALLEFLVRLISTVA